jgi:hypothetical protein
MGINRLEELPELSDAIKRKKPLSQRGHWSFLIIGILLVLIPSYFLYNLPRFDKSTFIICMPILLIIGILWSFVSIWSFAYPKSDYRKFQRSSRQSEGLIIHRYIDEHISSAGEKEHITQYFVVFEYVARQSDGTTKTIILNAEVDYPFYVKHEIGSRVGVHYAMDDPRLVYLDGEELPFGRLA